MCAGCWAGSRSRCFLDKLRMDIQKGAVSHIRSVRSPSRTRRPEGVRGSKLCGRELDSRPRGHRVLFDPWFFIVLESVALRGTREQGERERDTWSRGLRFVSTIRTGSVGLDGICDECTWTFYPTQVYLDVRCFLVTVEPYTRIVEVKSSPPSTR